jgi:hypothetical protein
MTDKYVRIKKGRREMGNEQTRRARVQDEVRWREGVEGGGGNARLESVSKRV